MQAVDFKYPKALGYNMLKVDISKQTYRLIPARTEGVRQNQTLSVELPQNAIVDLDSFFLSANFTPSGAAGSTFADLPKYATLFSKIVVEVGGVALHSCSYVEHLSNIMATLNSTAAQRKTKALYGEGSDRIVPTANSTKRVIIDDFLGFVGTAKPRLLDTGLTNTVKVVFHLSGGDALVGGVGATQGAFQLDDIYFGVSTYAIDDSRYYELYDTMLSAGNTLMVTYKNYFTHLNPVTGNNVSARFSVNTQSLDRVMACYLPNHGVIGPLDATTGNSAYYTRDGSTVSSWNFNINNTQFPMWNAGKQDAWPLVSEALDYKHTNKSLEQNCTTQGVWESKYWAAIYKFALPESQSDLVNRVSGVNGITMGLQVVFNGTGTATAAQNVLVVAECTSILEISSNRVVNTIA